MSSQLVQRTYWRCVVLDEGHIIKNEQTKISQVVSELMGGHCHLSPDPPGGGWAIQQSACPPIPLPQGGWFVHVQVKVVKVVRVSDLRNV